MGTKSKKKAKTRLDAYYRLAKDQGYRARSAFKLIQLNRKYDFLGKSRSVVDLCAAPGGWCQVAAKYMPIGSTVIGVDLVPIAPIRGVKTFVGDITDEKTRKTIHIYMKKELVDCVIHDGAPNVGGVWARDLFQQNALVLCALKIGTALLKPGGWFVSKVFRSQDFHKIMWLLKQFFDKVEATKPLASRMESAEIFVVCCGYKAPKNIDPKMFNPSHVFSDVAAEKVMTPSGLLVAPKNNVPQGYDVFNTIDTRIASVEDFLTCENPKDFLKFHYEIRFGEDEQHYLKSKWTKKELLYACQDLQQVGQGDRRRLIRWREQLLREHKVSHDDDDDAVSVDSAEEQLAADDNDYEGEPMDDTEAMASELLKMRKSHEKDIKKKLKKVVDRKLKQVRGLINHDPHEGAQHPTEMTDNFGVPEDQANDDEMGDGDWALANIKKLEENKVADMFDKHWEQLDESNVPLNAIVDVHLQQEEEIHMGDGKDQDHTDDHGQIHVEEGNEEAYDVDNYGNYVIADRSARVAVYDDPGAEVEEPEEPDADEDADAKIDAKKLAAQRKKEARIARDEGELDEAGKQAKWQRRHLNIDQVLNRTFPKPRDGKRKRNVDEERIEMRGTGEEASNVGSKTRGAKPARREGQQRLRDESSDDDDVSDLPSEDDDDDDIPVINKGRERSREKKKIVQDMGKLTVTELTKLQRKQLAKDNKEKRKKKTKESFEEIPIAMADPEVRARTLAMATRMLDKRARHDILEGGVNKYTHNDDDDLPDWFLKDEQRNCSVNIPVTASDIEAERARFLEISSRPGKKVAEAVGRRHRRAQRMLRGMIEKGKTDPRVREKTAGLSVRKLMRSTAVGGGGGATSGKKKKFVAMDQKKLGEKKREKGKMKFAKYGKRAGKK